MEIHFTARHFDLAPELREYITRKLEKLEHVQHQIREARVILTAENYRHIAEVTLLARRHEFVGREESADIHTSADLVIEKLDQQLRRFKDKRLSKNRRDGRNAVPAGAGESAGSRRISLRERHEEPRALSVDEALDELDDDGGEVLVFQNRETQKTSVLYRRLDGTFGLIEPAG
jgi:putative sigma-54 modulation protein